MKYETKKVDELIPYVNNPRNNDKSIEYVANSIKEFGFNEDICVIGNKYIVSKSGKVYTIYYSKRGIQEQKLRKHTNGYLRATIFGKDMYVHRLVALCFIKNVNNYKEVNHKDGNKHNNNVDNLEWCTRSQNNRHCFKTGLRNYEELSIMAKMPKLKSRKLKNEQIIEIINSKESDTILSKKYNIARGAIYKIRKKETYKEVLLNE